MSEPFSASAAVRPSAETAEGKHATSSRLALFLRASLFDALLVWVAAVALVFTVSFAFESAPHLRGDLLVIGPLVGAAVVILFAGSWSKRAAVAAGFGMMFYGGAVVFAAAALSPDAGASGGGLDDVAGNYIVFAFVAVIVPVLAFLLSRRPTGALLLFLAGTLACGWVQFLYRDWAAEPSIPAFLAFAVAACALVLYQRYRRAVLSVQSLARPAFGTAFLYALGAGMLVGAAAFALYSVLIAPLGLSTWDIKPFDDYYKRPIVYYSGVYETQDADDPNLVSGHLGEDEKATAGNAEGGSEEDSPDESSLENPIASLIAQTTAFDAESWAEEFADRGYSSLVVPVAATAAGTLVIAVVLAVVLRILRRERRLRALAGKDPSYGCWALYQFLSQRLARLGIVRDPSQTLMEFAVGNRCATAPFERDTGGVTWADCTLIYQRACLAAEGSSPDDLQDMERFYRVFYRNARRQLGWVRWIYWFWRL